MENLYTSFNDCIKFASKSCVFVKLNKLWLSFSDGVIEGWGYFDNHNEGPI